MTDDDNDSLVLRGFGNLSVFPNEGGYITIKQTDYHEDALIEFPPESAELVIKAIREAAAVIMGRAPT